MAAARIDLIGDSASAVRALDQTAVAAGTAGDAFKKLGVDADAAAAAITRANATRAENLLATSASLKQSAAANAGTVEGAVASEAAIKRQTQAYRLLGIQAATTRASLTQTAGTIGRGLTTYVTAPTAFIGYEAVKQAIDFNQQMLLLKTQAGDATDSIKQLSGEVLKLASSGAPQGPVMLAQGLFHLVSLGLRGSQALGTLRVSSIAAGMGLANLEDTTTALGAAVVSGIKGAQNYDQAMSVLVGTAGAGNMRFQDLASAIGNVLPSAAAAGISLHQMGAALAVLTDRGMSAEESATRLRMALALIQRPTANAQKALADMGVNANDLGTLLRQPNGLLKVLEVLHTAIQRVGVVRGNRDLLAAFGGARSGLGIQTLVQSLDSSVSSYQGKLQQISQDQQQFAANQQTYLQSPAYKLHAALAQVQADLVKLGQSLTPAVTALAGTISGIANAFSGLPTGVKQSIGVIVGILAVGGPLGMAIKGIGGLLGGLGNLFRLLIPAAATSATAVEASLAGIGTAAGAATGEVRGLRLSLLALENPLATLAVGIAALGAAEYGLLKAFNSGATQRGVTDKQGHPIGTQINVDGKTYYAPTGERGRMIPYQAAVDAGVVHEPNDARRGRGATAFGRIYGHRSHPDRTPGITDRSTSAPDVPGTAAAAAAAAARKRQTLFDQAVHNDQQLAQARIDLANGEYAAAQRLLLADQRRLQIMLSEAKTATERTDVLRQLAQVERLRHSKHDAFALSPKLQEEIAKADALAALKPSLQGPTSDQLRLAREAKAAAMKAINSHLLTLQGLTAAWQIVGQENAIIARAIGAINTYHAVQSKTIVDSVKGLDAIQKMQLRERIAQAEAHRGFAPNQVGTQGQRHSVDVHVHVTSNDSHIVKVVDKHRRGSHQRAGGRR